MNLRTMKEFTLIGPFEQIVTMDQIPLKGSISDPMLEIIEAGGIIIKNDTIIAVGRYTSLKESYPSAQLIEIKDKQVLLPGFIDAHTHICHAGSRANDYALRNAGSSYLEIAKSGGGIWDTVQKTRSASLEQLSQSTLERAGSMLKKGITTIEVKSGYGLSVEEELKMLRAIKQANLSSKADLIPTCLAAHIKPKDFEGNHKSYLDIIVDRLFPILLEEQLCSRIDAFIEEEAFNEGAVKRYFETAKELKFDITVHADQFSVGGSKIAVEYDAISADHLEASGEKEIALLANSNVISMALPGASIGLGCAFTPARKILDAGGSLAIASDWNPGSAPMGDLLTQATILGSFQKLSNAEVLAGITYRAARALGLKDRGLLRPNCKADFVSFPCNHVNEILYKQGSMQASAVWKNGIQYI